MSRNVQASRASFRRFCCFFGLEQLKINLYFLPLHCEQDHGISNIIVHVCEHNINE